MSTTRGRSICWPNPDATCLEGGCSWCQDYPVRTWGSIAAYARRAGQVRNRTNDDTKDARVAFAYGARNLGAPPGYHGSGRSG
jgi:hypothetical protein